MRQWSTIARRRGVGRRRKQASVSAAQREVSRLAHTFDCEASSPSDRCASRCRHRAFKVRASPHYGRPTAYGGSTRVRPWAVVRKFELAWRNPDIRGINRWISLETRRNLDIPRMSGMAPSGARLLHEARRPANANQQTIWPADPYLVQPPFPVTQDASWSDDQVVDPRSDGFDLRSSDEDAERIVIRGNAPRPIAGLGEMHLTLPAGQDDVVRVAASPREPEALPEWHSCEQIVAWNDRKGPDSCRNRH